MLYILILAGGPGTRLWPACRNNQPKQFLKFPGSVSLLRQSVERARGLVPDERIFIATRERYAEQMLAEIPDFPPENLLLEPYRRDTGPAVALVVAHLRRHDPSATLAVLTTDHLITDLPAFSQCLRKAAAVAHEFRASVTFGIPPTRPETAFGYLELGSKIQPDIPEVYELAAFREKPELEKAQEYLDAGNYLWNSGMFVWDVQVVAELYQEHAPKIWSGAEEIAEAGFTGVHFAASYAALPSISVDLSIMEKITTGYVVKANFGWEDIGSWRAFAANRPTDSAGNACVGRFVAMDTSGCLFEVSDKLVAAIGVKDLVVVDTPDALLICPKERDQEVKKLLQELEKMGLEEFL